MKGSLTLDHEVFDDSVEFRAFVAFSDGFLGEFLEVFGSLWHGSTEETDLDATGILTSNFNVEENLRKEKNLEPGGKKKSVDVSISPSEKGEKCREKLLESR